MELLSRVCARGVLSCGHKGLRSGRQPSSPACDGRTNDKTSSKHCQLSYANALIANA